MDPGARAAPLVAWVRLVLSLPPEPDAPLPPTPLPLPVLLMVAEPAQPNSTQTMDACHDVVFFNALTLVGAAGGSV